MSDTLIKAIGKRLAGKKVTYTEARALAKHDKLETVRLVNAHLRAFPAGEFRRLAGLSRTQFDAVVAQFRLPVGKSSVDVTAVLPSMFATLGAMDEVEASGGDSPALERLRRAKASMAELELAQRKRELVPVDEMRTRLGSMAAIARSRFEAMERAGGLGVRREIESLIDEWTEMTTRWFTDEEDTEATDEPEAPEAPAKVKAKAKAAAKAKAKGKTKQ